MTAPQNLESRARYVRDTWARRCNVAVFVSSEPAPHFPAVGLGVAEGRGQLYRKTIRALQYVHRQHRASADWFLKADDDTFVVLDNLRWLLAAHPPHGPDLPSTAVIPLPWPWPPARSPHVSLWSLCPKCSRGVP
uniref:N-acetylgalactosaminide beta-1,3-galactosyltransferase n=1 Tax=Cyanistes caeruleus TaxID=156563 RepID=A0A8C0U1H0_CYACU